MEKRFSTSLAVRARSAAVLLRLTTEPRACPASCRPSRYDGRMRRRTDLGEMLGRFNEDLATLTRAIRRGGGETLFNQFSRTRAIRRGIVNIDQDSPAPDFGRAHPDLLREPLRRRTDRADAGVHFDWIETCWNTLPARGRSCL